MGSNSIDDIGTQQLIEELMIHSLLEQGQDVDRNKQDALASDILQHTALSASDAARIVLELLENAELSSNTDTLHCLRQCRHIIQLGIECYQRDRQTVGFNMAVEALITNKSHRRKRTLLEIKQYSDRIIRNNPEWRNRPLRRITEQECQRVITSTFTTPSMQKKAHVILHGIFNFGLRRGWCASNPIVLLDAPHVKERRIPALSIKQIRKLLQTALTDQHLCCAPALGLMLWAGIRPNEVERLQWKHINPSENIITIHPQHSKTGGSRQVNMYPALKRWLVRVAPYTLPEAPIIPRSWERRWRHLRVSAGFNEWQADILRHSFASYHLKHFRNLASLQLDMGHSSAELLRTRYLAMEGITKQHADHFWKELPLIEELPISL